MRALIPRTNDESRSAPNEPAVIGIFGIATVSDLRLVDPAAGFAYLLAIARLTDIPR